MAARSLDHLVLGVRDLDAAAAFYDRLGFTVGAMNKHPWGTWNRIVQFPGCFLEIITVGEPEKIPEHQPGRFSFGAFVRDALRVGEGFSMLALESPDSEATNVEWRLAGIGPFEPFFFERRGRRPDGSEVRVAFSLAFANNAAAPGAGFFVCQQHEPQNFWNPLFQSHANGAVTVAEVSFGAADPAAHAPFFERFTGAEGSAIESGGSRFVLPRGSISLLREAGPPRWRGMTIQCADMTRVESRLAQAGISFSREGDALIVPEALAFGVRLAFRN